MTTTLINVKTDPKPHPDHYVYIGRRRGTEKHFGNPFTHLPDVPDTIQLPGRGVCITSYEDWLLKMGPYRDLDPNRRAWILNNLKGLEGKTLGCYCSPLSCHGGVLIRLLNNETEAS